MAAEFIHEEGVGTRVVLTRDERLDGWRVKGDARWVILQNPWQFPTAWDVFWCPDGSAKGPTLDDDHEFIHNAPTLTDVRFEIAGIVRQRTT